MVGGMEAHEGIVSRNGAGASTLLLLMTVLTQALLALVSSNLMTFPLFTARHIILF